MMNKFMVLSSCVLCVVMGSLCLAGEVKGKTDGGMGTAKHKGAPKVGDIHHHTGKTDGGMGKAKYEPFAFTVAFGYLDGPRLEAMGTDKGRKGANDEEGNIFIFNKLASASMRCIRLDGVIETITGDDRWSPRLGETEGPAACMPNMCEGLIAGSQSYLLSDLAVYGLPLKGEDYGCIYLYNMKKRSYKIYKNKEQGDRWWFKLLGVPGGPKPPTTIGESAQVEEVDMTEVRIGSGWMTWEGCLYKFDSANERMTCILTPADYVSRAQAAVLAFGKKDKAIMNMKEADRLILADDGTMYVMHPWREGNVFKISKDRSKLEYIIQCNKNVKGWNRDGPGLYTTWHCGPSWIKMSGDTLFLRAIDSPSTRRWRDGRISVLCMDGEWREHSVSGKKKDVISPSGMGYRVADYGLPYIFIYYIGADHRMFRFGPVDFTKPTIGPLVQLKGE